MSFTPDFAAIRFGVGLGPQTQPPQSVDAMVALLRGPDVAVRDRPIIGFDDINPDLGEIRDQMRIRRQNRGTDIADAANMRIREIRRLWDGRRYEALRDVFLRGIQSPDGLRERLTFFWGDHFTARSTKGLLNDVTSGYVADAIRPHVAGRFADMLKSVVRHPLMIVYLNQVDSMGPNSREGLRRGRGLNENLAREILELHTLGVDGPYTQEDVIQLAELLTGITYQAGQGFRWKTNLVEPGAETILGTSYGGDKPSPDAIDAALEDLAIHPSTADHLARKMAVHFVSDIPSELLVRSMSEAYLKSGGDLLTLTEAMLRHPDAWRRENGNVKLPIEFMVSAYKALDVHPKILEGMSVRSINNRISIPMISMGQHWERPLGPDGWPEKDSSWITPQGLAARMQWAFTGPREVIKQLPDPRVVAKNALGSELPESVRFAAAAADNRRDGIGVILASPAFQRR